VCDDRAKQKYLRRFSGPLLDRFDLRVAVTRPHVDELLAAQPNESSQQIAARVMRARQYALQRNGCLNSALPADLLDVHAPLTDGAAKLLGVAITEFAVLLAPLPTCTPSRNMWKKNTLQ
jgi:magnesium chelatase family protein